MPEIAALCPNANDRRDVWNAKLLRWCRYDGRYEMPTLLKCDILPDSLIAFPKAQVKKADGSFLHFYTDDYKCERVWKNQSRYLPLIQAYGGAITPDFSLYREMPLAQQIYNVFRSRVLGYWWSRNGVPVIPNARWGDDRTYEFCFDGLPHNSVIAIGAHGCTKTLDDRRQFLDGFMVMLDRITPKVIVAYGSISNRLLPPLYRNNIEIIQFDSDYSLSHKKGAS